LEDIQKKAIEDVARIRQRAAELGLDKMDSETIDKEIRAVRSQRKSAEKKSERE